MVNLFMCQLRWDRRISFHNERTVVGEEGIEGNRRHDAVEEEVVVRLPRVSAVAVLVDLVLLHVVDDSPALVPDLHLAKFIGG